MVPPLVSSSSSSSAAFVPTQHTKQHFTTMTPAAMDYLRQTSSTDEEKKEDVVVSVRLCIDCRDEDRSATSAAAKEASTCLRTDDSSYNAKPLEVTKESDGRIVIHSIIPEGFAIVDNTVFEGKRIVATKSFPKGDVVYVAYAAMLDLSDAGHGHVLRTYEEQIDETSGAPRRRLLEEFHNSDTHSVDDHGDGSKGEGASKRQVFGWDGFMNHSCDANVYFPLLYRTPTEMCYRAIAVRNIEAGEEVTCDYALFDYDCDGHEIEACACKSAKCRGKMLGFKGMTLHEKVEMLGMAEEEIRRKFAEDDNVAIFRTVLPGGIMLKQDTDTSYRHLVATRAFEDGSLLFANRVVPVPKCDLDAGKRLVLEVDGCREHILLDNEHHLIHRGDYAEMLGFDSFMDHSCSPNTYQSYIDRENYVVYARRTIVPGEKITCDYMALENEALGEGQGGNVGTSTFVCECGEGNCRGVLVC